ncbi:MAG TPA: hypothetical protein VES36_06375 [Candidatus Limnocylindrales bacterium]|nr:hypothetical protein [Candidatus Limnocylindrales bacterium]
MAEVREGDFVLRITAPHSSWATDEPIAVSATLTYDGALEEIELGASGSGPIAFSVVELEGTRAMKAGWDQDCAQHRLMRNQPLLKPYAKSGAWSGGDPNEAFYREFFADPEFRLPAGRWDVSAETLFSVGECSADNVEMRATIVLDVKPSVAEESASSTASDEPSPSPVLVAVPTDPPFPPGTPGPCPAALITGTLVRDAETGLALHLDEGLRMAVTWPFGYVARDGTSGLELLDADGEVVAHEGDRVALGGGELRGGQAWRACTGVDQIITPSESATPSSSR